MTAKNKIRLVVAASYGSALFYNSAFAACEKPSIPRSHSSDLDFGKVYKGDSEGSEELERFRIVQREKGKRRKGDSPKSERLSFVQRPPSRQYPQSHQCSSPVSESDGGEEFSDDSHGGMSPEEFGCGTKRPYRVVVSGTRVPMHRRRVDGRRQDSAPPELALPDEHVEKKSHRRRHRKQQDSAPPELALTSGGIEPFPLMLQERRPVLLPRISTDHVSDRRPTMTDFLSERGDHRMSAEDQEQNLAQTIKEFIVRYTREAVPEFVTFIVDGFERAQRKSDQEEQRDALERMLRLRLLNQETFKYITHGAQSPQEAMLMFEQAGEFVQGQTGAIYKIKCRVMDETLLIIRRFIYPDIPDEAVAELEEYIDNLLLPLSNALVDVVFELLRDDTFAPTGCCGCCKKLSSDDKRLIAGGAIQMTGAILGKVFGSGFEQGANIVAQGICGSIQRSRSNED